MKINHVNEQIFGALKVGTVVECFRTGARFEKLFFDNEETWASWCGEKYLTNGMMEFEICQVFYIIEDEDLSWMEQVPFVDDEL